MEAVPYEFLTQPFIKVSRQKNTQFHRISFPPPKRVVPPREVIYYWFAAIVRMSCMVQAENECGNMPLKCQFLVCYVGEFDTMSISSEREFGSGLEMCERDTLFSICSFQIILSQYVSLFSLLVLLYPRPTQKRQKSKKR